VSDIKENKQWQAWPK